MALGFSDIDEQYEYESEMYDNGCSMIGTSDDIDFINNQSQKYNEDCSILGVHT